MKEPVNPDLCRQRMDKASLGDNEAFNALAASVHENLYRFPLAKKGRTNMTRNRTIVAVLAALAACGLLACCALAQHQDGAFQPPGGPPVHPGPGPGAAPGGPPASAGHPPVFRPEQAERMERMMDMLQQFRRTAFDPGMAGMVAIGGLKDDVHRKPAEIINDLENQLTKTKSLGLRNALRLSLKDLYKAQAEDEKVLEHLRAMIAENDAALEAGPPMEKPVKK